MSSKKWFLLLISITMVIVLLFGSLQFYLDPLLQYGGERGPLTYRTYTEIYCNPGIAKNYDYNAVLLGSSMVENTDINELNDLFDCNTIKVTYAGGSSYNHKRILDVCYNSGHKIDKVFWALDEYALTTDVNTPRWPLPEYLYDENRINDVSYLLNLDVFYYYTLIDIEGTIKHEKKAMMSEGIMLGDDSLYCKKNALASISYPMEQQEIIEESTYESVVEQNLLCNILPCVENHPETEFHFFMVPYSILYWYQIKRDGSLAAELFNAKLAIEKLLSYDNVKVHFFQNQTNIITNLDNYKDYSHYSPSINNWMIKEMKTNNYLLLRDNYLHVMSDFYTYLDEFDYDDYYLKQNTVSTDN